MVNKILTLFFPVLLMAGLYDNNDHGFWMDEKITVRLPKDWIFSFNPQERWQNDYKTYCDTEYEFNLIANITSKLDLYPSSSVKNVNFGFAYTYIDELRNNTKGELGWTLINRYGLMLMITHKFGAWTITQRLRPQYEAFITKYHKSHGNFRYRLLLQSPWEWTTFKFNPYVSNEFFFRINTFHPSHPTGLVGGFFQNRFRIGLNYEIFKDKLFADSYFMIRSIKQRPGTHPSWFNNWIWGLSLNYMYN